MGKQILRKSGLIGKVLVVSLLTVSVVTCISYCRDKQEKKMIENKGIYQIENCLYRDFNYKTD